MSNTLPRVILIDDDPDAHDVIKLILSDRCEVTCCSTGDEGLERVRRAVPDLVLLDIMLSQPHEGVQVACQMRQDAVMKDVPIIFTSAIGAEYEAAYAREMCPVALDAAMFLEKPLDAATVREAVEWVLERRPARQ